MKVDTSFWDSLVFDGIDELDVEAVTAAYGTVDVTARGRAAGAACPDRSRFSERVHDSYLRRLRDLPLGGRRFTTSDLDDLLARLDRHASADRQEESSVAPAA